jgi:hypothetical protein|tara:strand:+ start:125 stop:340 length:216 start_codon:yes stop_codon:yes gene_type:complete
MKKSNSIDLHGRYYDDVDLSLEKHFYDNEPPFKIITGNSSKMKEKVLKYLENNNHKYMSGNMYNQGYIQVL